MEKESLLNTESKVTARTMTQNDPLQASALHLLHRAGQCAGDVFQAEMASGDLTPRQFAVLVAVSQDEGLSQTSLVRKTGIDRSTLADIVRRMLRKGLLQRQRTKDDARAYSVKLTDEGWSALRRAQPTVEIVDTRVLSVLPEADRERFIEDLAKIVTALSQPDTPVSRP
jgi:DNA-binding MarR family transcriptional regulator